MPLEIETIIVGGGQAGLAMSYHLRQLGREHLVLERARIAERWRAERWDSLTFQFPNWMIRLPGFVYGGDDPDAFMHKDGIVRFLEEYARRIAAPVQSGVRVIALDVNESRKRLLVRTDEVTLEAANVVVATGPYQRPFVPSLGASLPGSIYQVTANRY